MNVEHVYQTTASADEIARALADHFRIQGFETQVFETTNNRTVMQARKDSLWRVVDERVNAALASATPHASSPA